MEAAGKKVGANAAMNCFNCHATNAVANGKLTVPQMEPGLRCARCHEAAPKHLAGLSQGELDLGEMKKLTLMSPEQTITFCGQCHRTAVDVQTDAMDLNTVRFAPYRLTLSKCYDPGDKRITCTACHDPHQEVGVQQVDYDSKCQACHVAGKTSVPACKIATKDCTSCHMAKIDLPGAHHRFTDHWIRIDKATAQRASQ